MQRAEADGSASLRTRLQLAQAIEQGARDRYLGWPEKFFVRLNSLFPRLVDRTLIRQAARMQPYALQSVPESLNGASR